MLVDVHPSFALSCASLYSQGVTEIQIVRTSASLPFKFEVQTIRTAAASGTTLSGSFYVGFNYAQPVVVPYNASASDMEAYLESLPTIRDVLVTRVPNTDTTFTGGFIWTVRLMLQF